MDKETLEWALSAFKEVDEDEFYETMGLSTWQRYKRSIHKWGTEDRSDHSLGYYYEEVE